MFKKYPILKRSLIGLLVLVIFVFSFGYWFISLLPEKDAIPNYEKTRPTDLPYLQSSVSDNRGKILMIVTSIAEMGPEKKPTGYELTELARPYYVFQANGFIVDIASPQGGEPPMIIDKDDMGPYDYAFLNDDRAQKKLRQSIPVNKVQPEDYEALFFVGGKGAMFDFPENPVIQSLVANRYENKKVIGAVCHGPAALVNVTLSNGNLLVAGKNVSGFTNEEELFLIPDASEIFPFLLEDKLTAQGGLIKKATPYLQQVSVDGRLVTGQNPWSTWKTAESMVRQMGYIPIERAISEQENTIALLQLYEKQGSNFAMNTLKNWLTEKNIGVDRFLLAQHCLVAAMQGKLGKTKDLLSLLRLAKVLSSHS